MLLSTERTRLREFYSAFRDGGLTCFAVPHTAIHYEAARFRRNVGAAAREFIEDLLGRGPIRDLIRLDDD
jgi:hypothetical protein